MVVLRTNNDLKPEHLDQKLSVCFVIGGLGQGGAEKQLYELIKGLNKQKFDPFVVSLSEGGYWSSEIKKLGIRLIELVRKRNIEFTRLINLIKIFIKYKPDIVHTYLFPGNSYGRIAGFFSMIPVVIASERNAAEIGKDKRKSSIFIAKILSYISYKIICNTKEGEKNLITKYSFKPHKVMTIQNGINLSDFVNGSIHTIVNKPAQKVIGTIGSLTPQKNHKLFLKTVKSVLELYHEKTLKFLIVGSGFLKAELEEYCQQLELDKHVIFTGSQKDVRPFLKRMDIFLFTSLYEGMPNVIMEAMAYSLPVVTTNVGGAGELVVNEETGFLCSLDDEKTLAEKTIYLLQNEEIAKRMGENGKEYMKNNFSSERMISQTENLYLEAVLNNSISKRRLR